MEAVIDRVEQELNVDPWAKNLKIKVSYDDGMIILSGEATSFHQNQMIQEAAQRALEYKCPYFCLAVQNTINVKT
jgi:osmotically-inducible protein OsmY